jgi:hypothetical protein
MNEEIRHGVNRARSHFHGSRSTGSQCVTGRCPVLSAAHNITRRVCTVAGKEAGHQIASSRNREAPVFLLRLPGSTPGI